MLQSKTKGSCEDFLMLWFYSKYYTGKVKMAKFCYCYKHWIDLISS